MAGSSSSVSNNQSTSQSETRVLDYPERAFLDAIAQYAGTAGQNVYNWAQTEYAKNSALTDANVNNYLNTSQRALNQAGALNDRYNNKINPEIDQQLREADLYNSKDRQLMDMGAAESGQMQGAEAALANHKRDLQSYGIDPSAGRYAGLDEAARVSAAAGAVGAAQQARQFDVTTGQNLRQQGINNASSAAVAQNAGVINDYNTALQGFAGSENAGLANANTGVSMFGAANPFLSTAMNYKPITGNFSQSQSTGSSVSNSQQTDPSGSGSQQKSPSQQQQSGGGGDGSGGGGSSSGGFGSGGYGSGGTSSLGDGSDVWGSGSGTDYSGIPDSGGLSGGFGYDPSGSDGSLGDNWSNFVDTSGNSMGYQDPFNDYGGAGGFSGGDWGLGSYGGASDYGSFDYAEGGAIEDDDTSAIPENGGAIPTSASPSGGAVTDDVRAQLPSGKQINVNAREFVIPEDVARWKGEEYFQKLIAQSRQARAMAPAKPSMGPMNA